MGFLIELHGDPNLSLPTRRAASRVAQIFSDFFRVIRELEVNLTEDAAIELTAIQNHLEASINTYLSFRDRADPREFVVQERIVTSISHLRNSLESSQSLPLTGVDGEVRPMLDNVFNTIAGTRTTHLSLVELSIGLLHATKILAGAMRDRGLHPVREARAILLTVFIIQILMTNIAEISADSQLGQG